MTTKTRSRSIATHTVARRAERCVVRLLKACLVADPEVLCYLNRLSDLPWLLVRRIEIEHGFNSALRV